MSKNKKMHLVPSLRFPEFHDSEEWKAYNLGSILIKNSVKNKKMKYSLVQSVSNKYGFINQEDYFDNKIVASKDTSNYYVIKKGCFAYNPSRIDVGSLAYKQDNQTSIVSPLYVSFKANNDKVEDLFLLDWFLSENFRKQMIFEGGVRNTLNYENLSEMKILLPTITEQQKIADCLSSLDDLISAEDKKLEALNSHKKGLMQKLFPTDGSVTPAIRLNGFVNHWERRRLGDVAEISSGGTPNRNVASYWNGDIPWVTTSEVNYSFIKKTTEQITNDGLNNSSAKLLPVGTILMAMYGQGKTRGQVAMLEVEASTNQANANIIIHSDVHNYFIYYQLVKGYEDIRLLANEGGQANLSLGIIKKLPIAVVNNTDEQIAIGNLFRDLDELITAQSEKIATLHSHKKGLMQGLFPSVEEVGK